MLNNEAGQKVTTAHLKKNAFLYIRQSTLRQVIENTESTKRQYNLQKQAERLGWPCNQIKIIDTDMGESGASQDREGFKKLVSEVGLGNAGIVMSLEVSRLARNSTDWHRLIEICALTGTLILDEEGVYNPSHFNDRLLLGLKGTMSEAELYLIRSRLIGGMLNKAKRGELKVRPPVGLIYDSSNRIQLDPDKRVQESVNLLFKTFRRLGTAGATLREFHKTNILFPKQIFSGPNKGIIVFSKLTYSRIFEVLKNPRYAGAFVFGRRRQIRKDIEGGMTVKYTTRDQWKSLVLDIHKGYITWQEYEENLQRIADNNYKVGKIRCPPREGPALLQGIVLCGICGSKMSVRYHTRRGSLLSPDYNCYGSQKRFGSKHCQTVQGDMLDKKIVDLVVETISPSSLEIALGVQNELKTRMEETQRLHYRHVEKAQYEMDLSKRRFMSVDPINRLVADELELDWNNKIQEYRKTKNEFEDKRQKEVYEITEVQRQKILSLAVDIPNLWNNPKTTIKDKKRIIRLLIEDVTLIKNETEIVAQIRLRGGQNNTVVVRAPKSAWIEKKHSPEVVEKINTLLENHTDGEAAHILNEAGLTSGTGKTFSSERVSVIRRAYKLKSFYSHLRMKNLLTIKELCEKYNVTRYTVYDWRNAGKIKGIKYDDVGRYLYSDPNFKVTINSEGIKKTTQTAQEVQYA